MPASTTAVCRSFLDSPYRGVRAGVALQERGLLGHEGMCCQDIILSTGMAETEIIFSLQKSPDGGYEARALGHSIFVRAQTMEELRANVKDAAACHFADRKILPPIRLAKVRYKGIPGSANGEFTVPDDFNNPLPKEIEDLFWE